VRVRDFYLEHLHDNKVLIVPYRSIGFQFIWRLTKELGGCFNFKIATLSDLAEDIMADYMLEHEIRLMNDKEGSHIIYTLLHETTTASFFKKEQCTMELATEIFQTILESKQYNLSVESLQTITSEKMDTISKLMELYNSTLKSLQLWDQADLYQYAKTHLVPASANLRFAVLSNLELTPLEKNFFEHLTNGYYNVLQMPVPTGLTIPRFYEESLQSVNHDFHHPILNVYNDEFKKTESVRLFKAFGKTNEVNYVFQQLLKDKVPFDEAILLYTASDYAHLIKRAAEYFDVPVTLGSGVDITSTKAFHFIKELCQYIQNGYRIEDLKGIFYDGSLEIEGKAGEGQDDSNSKKTSPRKMYEMLSTLNIGWGIDRAIEKLKEKVNEEDNKKPQHIPIYQGLIVFFEDIKAATKDFDGEFDFHLFIKGMLQLASKYIRVEAFKVKLESVARNVIITELNDLLTIPPLKMTLAENINRLINQLEKLTISQSTETPGHLHVDSYARGGLIRRKHVYVIGLDAKKFPVSKNESPILTDAERTKLSPHLRQSKDYETYSKYKLLEVLGTAKGTITLGYSYYDTAKVRENNPSTFIQQVMEKLELTNQEVLDFGFIAKDSALIAGDLGAYLSAWNDNEFLQERYEFKRTPLASDMTYDTSNQVLSASAIDRMASCHRKFYFYDVLKIRKKDELQFDTGQWLKSNEIGTLYHRIFERFISEVVMQKKENVKMVDIVKEEFNNKRLEVPCPMEELYINELEKALKISEGFAEKTFKDMERRGWTPFAVEHAFNDVKITLSPENENSLEFSIKGVIDRIDDFGDGTYRIVDYKTGKRSNFEKKKYQLQHYLYKLAYEAALREKGRIDDKVTEAYYDFPMDQSEMVFKGDELVRKETKNQSIELQDILSELINQINAGSTAPTSDISNCKFCEYKEICRIHNDEVNG
jgi:ATP-dependent helicase/DNAse subunit B